MVLGCHDLRGLRVARSGQAVDEVHRLRLPAVGAGAHRIQRRRGRARHRRRLPADGQVLPAARLGRGDRDPAGRRAGRRRLLHRRPAQLDQAVGAQQQPGAAGQLDRPQRAEQRRAEPAYPGEHHGISAQRRRARPRPDEHQATAGELVLPLLQRGARRLAGGAGRTRRARPAGTADAGRLRRLASRAGAQAAAVGTDGRRRARPGGHRRRLACARRQLVLRRGPALPHAVAAIRHHRRARPRSVAAESVRPATPVRPVAPGGHGRAGHPAAGHEARRPQGGGHAPPSRWALHPAACRDPTRRRPRERVAGHGEAGQHESLRTRRRPGLRLRRQPARRPGGRADRPRLLCAAAGTAVDVRCHHFLWLAYRGGLLHGRRARQGPAVAAHHLPAGRDRRGDQRAGLDSLRRPVPARVLPADAARL